MKIGYNFNNRLTIQEVSELPSFECIEITPEIESSLQTMYIPLLVNGVVVESASQEFIEQQQRSHVPESISQMKLRKQLILSGISIASIDALIQTLPQPNRDLIYTMWEYAVVFDRSNPELNAMAQMLQITSEQLDEIFINGNLL